MPASLKIRKAAKGVVVFVRLTPKSACHDIEGLEDFGGETRLKARVCAQLEADRANAEPEKLIGSACRPAKS